MADADPISWLSADYSLPMTKTMTFVSCMNLCYALFVFLKVSLYPDKKVGIYLHLCY